MSFELHPQLAKDSFVVGDLTLCRVLLMNDARFPWLILVPRRENLRELFDLAAEDYTMAMQEIKNIAELFSKFCGACKMNVAALGNMVPQLHIHIIARKIEDEAWPQPIWSIKTEAKPYSPAETSAIIKQLQGLLPIIKS